MIRVKILNVGSSNVTITVSLSERATVADALREAKVESSGRSIRINREPGSLSTILNDEDTIILASKVDGGSDYTVSKK